MPTLWQQTRLVPRYRYGLGSKRQGYHLKKIAIGGSPWAGKAAAMAADAMKSNTDAPERERALQSAWVCTRELVGTKGKLAEITELLGDIRTLAQQEVDLLRRIVERNARK